MPPNSSYFNHLTRLCLKFSPRLWLKQCYSCVWTQPEFSSVTCQTGPSAKPSWRHGGVWRPGCAWRQRTKDRYQLERLCVPVITEPVSELQGLFFFFLPNPSWLAGVLSKFVSWISECKMVMLDLQVKVFWSYLSYIKRPKNSYCLKYFSPKQK